MTVIGRLQITMDRLAPTGDRRDYLVRVVGPGETDHTFPISITGSVLAVWEAHGSQTDDEAIRGQLAAALVDIHGTAKSFPEKGYWFDSYNSEHTLRETCNKIRNVGELPFRKDRTVSDDLGRVLSADLLSVLDRVNNSFIGNVGEALLLSIDAAFEPSEAQEDLGTPPDDKPGFMYRICILSVIIDRFGIRLETERQNTSSLVALRSWLNQRVGEAMSRLP